MSVKQISIFIENKKGSLAEVTKFIAESKINLKALSIADSQDFGILRIITDTPNEARELLQLPAKEGGDQLVMNGNYIPITMVGEQYKSSPEGGENSGGN